MQAKRGAGAVHLVVRGRSTGAARADSRDLADALVQAVGLRPLGTAWRELASHEALAALRNVLHWDLAYDGALMPEPLAAQLAAEFLARFEPSARFFTNATFPVASVRADVGGGWMGSWDPLTDATFDTGIVAVGEHEVALLWFEDED